MGEGECEPNETLKKGRHRKKHLYNTILQQMEFYFSDSNLSKDRFLSQIIQRDSYVDLNVFLSFNKIRKLNCSVADLKKAISKSELIELSEDKDKICRKKPLIVKENVEECTIYVENIKADADHEELKHFFSDFGNVAYVSIPKYKHTKGNKGFAFIEFEKEEDASNALSYFESIGCKMPSDTNPEELVSVKSFVEENKNVNEISEGQTDKSANEDMASAEEKSSKKRKLSHHDEKVVKKIKTDSEDDSAHKEEAVDVSQKEETDHKKKKKHKKDKKKSYIRDLGLTILSKKDWKKLRNRYLDLQRKKMKEFKEYLYKQKSSKNFDKESSAKDNTAEYHGQNQTESNEVLEFTRGVIVKINLPKPCSDPKKIKNDLKTLCPDIKYVDVPLPAGCEEVYARFSNSDSAKQFCEQDSVGAKTVLEGEEEQRYWEKIHNDRQVKISKNVRKQRGREKLLKKAETLRAQHLRFDEGD